MRTATGSWGGNANQWFDSSTGLYSGSGSAALNSARLGSQGIAVDDYDPERNAIEAGSVGVPIMSMSGFQMPGMGDFRGGDVNVSNPDQKSMLLIALLAFIVLILKLK